MIRIGDFVALKYNIPELRKNSVLKVVGIDTIPNVYKCRDCRTGMACYVKSCYLKNLSQVYDSFTVCVNVEHFPAEGETPITVTAGALFGDNFYCGIARCNPSDTFDFGWGVDLAVSRLLYKMESFERKKMQECDKAFDDLRKEAARETQREVHEKRVAARVAKAKAKKEKEVKKPYNGAVRCVDPGINYNFYKEGKVYQFRNGFLKDECGYPIPSLPIHSFEEWQKWSSAEWEEVK